MKYALINDQGVVDNIAEWDGQSDYRPEGTVKKIPDGIAVNIGDSFDGQNFILLNLPPKPDAPNQALLDLQTQKITLSQLVTKTQQDIVQIDTAIAAIQNPLSTNPTQEELNVI